jgi:hypothetical protein
VAERYKQHPLPQNLKPKVDSGPKQWLTMVSRRNPRRTGK